MLRISRITAAILLFTLSAHAASPQLTRILPRGAQRGTTVELSFEGARLNDPQEVFVYSPGITITKVESAVDKDKKPNDKQVKVTAQIAPDARLGEYVFRLRTAGASPKPKHSSSVRCPSPPKSSPTTISKSPSRSRSIRRSPA